MKLSTAILAIYLMMAVSINATVRYVSKTGSSTPPYTSWATAADSIQKAIDISVFGDTIYVANGVYEEQIYMIKGLALIGSGIDSCIIDTRLVNMQWPSSSVNVMDSCTFKNFQVINPLQTGHGIFTVQETPHIGIDAIIEYNFVKDADWGIYVNGPDTIVIRHNIVENCYWGIRLGDADISNLYYAIVDSNYITALSTSIEGGLGISAMIRGNVGMMKENSYRFLRSGTGEATIFNNLVVSEDVTTCIGLTAQAHKAYNNTFYCNTGFRGILCTQNNTIKNNLIIGAIRGIENYSFMNKSDDADVKYNNVWQAAYPYVGFSTFPLTNLIVDPMIVSEDSLDFHLQMFSPMIDAGDPNILDVDGSRSDIGVFGGPYGEKYTYQDLAPRSPRNVTAVLDSEIVTLTWLPNTEADFYQYKIYRDTIPNFIIDTTKLIAIIGDTTYSELLPIMETNLYYKLTAIDSQMNESGPSEEVAIIIVGVKEPELNANSYKLFAPYPNPFNPGTTISYRLKEGGRVRLVVYDIKGSRITELVNEYKPTGYYETYFDAGKLRLASGVYLYKLEVYNQNNIPVYTELKKMIMVK